MQERSFPTEGTRRKIASLVERLGDGSGARNRNFLSKEKNPLLYALAICEDETRAIKLVIRQ